MPLYNIKAVKSDNDSYTETVEAAGKLELYQIIKGRGHTLISAEQKSDSGFRLLARLKNLSWGGSVKSQEIITAIHNLSAMLSAGLSLSKALSVLRRQSRNRKFKTILNDIQNHIESGETLSQALARHQTIFSKLLIASVRAGEEGGNLSSSLDTVGAQMEKSEALKKRIKGAMIYPSIILGVMVLIAGLMITFVVPILSETFADLDVDLPVLTQIIIDLSGFIMNQPILIGSTLLLAIGGIIYFFRTEVGQRRLDWLLLRLPVIRGITKEVNAARTARALSSLLASGVDPVSALGIVRDVVQNSYYKPILEQAENDIQKGQPISDAFVANEHLYPVLVGEMIAVGEETGKIEEMLTRVADFFESEVEQKTQDLSTIIEPVLMIIIGLAVGLFAVSMLSPIYQMMEHI